MIRLRLIVDTNIVVQAALKDAGLHRTVLLLAISKPARLYVLKAALTEYRGVSKACGSVGGIAGRRIGVMNIVPVRVTERTRQAGRFSKRWRCRSGASAWRRRRERRPVALKLRCKALWPRHA